MVNKSDIKLAGDIAWEEHIKDDCSCGAEERRECRCLRNESFRKRAREIRKNWFGGEWDKPIQNMIRNKKNGIKDLE